MNSSGKVACRWRSSVSFTNAAQPEEDAGTRLQRHRKMGADAASVQNR